MLLSSDLPVISSLLRVADITFSNAVATASLYIDPKTTRTTIQCNKDFVSQYADKPSRFAALIAHELMHHMLHHYSYIDPTPLTHIASDVLINSLINRLSPTLVQLFNDLYEKDTFPSCILRPGGNVRRIEHAEIRAMVTDIATKLWPKNYYSQRAAITLDDLSTSLEEILKLCKEKAKLNVANKDPDSLGLGGIEPDWYREGSMFLLGDHTDKKEDTFSEAENEQSDIGELLEGLIGEMAGVGGELASSMFKINQRKGPEELAEALGSALRKDILLKQEIVETICGRELSDESPFPLYIGKREQVQLAFGWYPLSYPTHGPGEDEQASGDVTIYLDVSGSMGDQALFILMLLTNFKNRVSNELFQFSTKIETINFGQMVEHYETTGELFIASTGGTDFDPIFRHAFEQNFDKILLITDGMASVKDPVLVDFAKSIETYTLFTKSHNPNPLTELSVKTWIMPELET